MAATLDQKLTFSKDIEEIVYMKDISYMEAILDYCEEKQVEIEVAASLIDDNIKSQIQIEAESLNFLPKSNTTKLPL